MKFNPALIIFTLIIFTITINSQTTYFIKYKGNVSANAVAANVLENKISNTIANRQISMPEFNIDYLAKGLGKEDEVLGRIVKIQFAENVDEANFNSMLAIDPDIEYIQKSTTYQLDFVPNDSLIADQWALQKIKAFDAWNITQGSDSVLLAIIDTGIDYLHPDLRNKIYYNNGEIGIDNFGKDKKTNNVDDDRNGFIDDYQGWDFTDRVGFPFDTSGGDYLNWDNDPFDDHGHGTYISGIAGAETNNILGVAGAAPNIMMLNLRAFDPGGYGEEDDVAAAILYAVQNGAKVINMSFGDNSFSLILRDVIRYAYSRNVVLVASAGNSGSSAPHYPSGYSEVISVGNSTDQDFVSSNSNYGSTIDLVAPGSSIVTTAKKYNYASISGTSASAPYVSASAALVLSLQNFSNEEVKQILKSTSDDIGETGWDIRSGAGRLNLNTALNVLAPAEIKFHSPKMDFATNLDTIDIKASVLSPYFLSYSLEFGSGLNPTSWNILIDNSRNQFVNKSIYNLNVSQFQEGSYTLKLIVRQSNGRTLEERVNLHIIRKPPKFELVGDGPIYYGDVPTLQAEVYTNQRSIVRMYYRKIGAQNFNFITLDGFNTNNQFIKQFHYGFIPKTLVESSTLYEVYYEAENLAGLKTSVVDTANNLSYFLYNTEESPEPIIRHELPFSLPPGILLKDPVNFLSSNKDEVLFQEFYSSSDIYYTLFRLEQDSFIRKDSIKNKIPRIFGDYNNNGKKEIISVLYPNGFLDEQTQSGNFSFTNKSTDTNLYYPLIADDIDGDGKIELMVNGNDLSYIVYRINNDLSYTLVDTVYKTYKDTLEGNFEFNNWAYNNLTIADINKDGKKEIWFVDADGDLKSIIVNEPGSFSRGDSLVTPFRIPKSNALTIGDYDGDGFSDIAIIYRINSIAPNFLLLVLNYKNGEFNLISQKVFLDQSEEYSNSTFSRTYQSIKFIDFDNDGRDELVLNLFPYAYILKHDSNKDKIVFFEEGVNSIHVFEGDLNQNGITETAFSYSNGIKFFEFATSSGPAIPKELTGYSIDSTRIILSWKGETNQYYIYRSENPTNLILIDSVTTNNYEDLVTSNTFYYYAVRAFDPTNPEPLSGLSKIVEVYSHTPAKAIEANSLSANTVNVKFTNRIKNTIENLRSFEIIGTGYPNSVSPNDQFSYLLSFNQPLIEGINYLVVNGLRDHYNSPIESDTIQFNVLNNPTQSDLFVESFEILNPYLIKLKFNLPVDESSASEIANYSFSPNNKVTSIVIDQNEKSAIFLDMKNNKPIGTVGIEYVLKIENLISSNTTGNLPIRKGAGSYVVLTGFSKDLSDVYVYPNPIRTSEGKNYLTFANLPKRVNIIIWDINGNKVRELEERDGNGGLDFDLKNETGESIASGIYIYRAVMIDDQNNEGEEKLGKFAILK